MSGWVSLILGWTLGFGLNVLAVTSWCWNHPTRVSLKVLVSWLYAEKYDCVGYWAVVIHYCETDTSKVFQTCWGAQLEILDLSQALDELFGHSQQGLKAMSACLITDLVEAEAAQTVCAEHSLERFPGMKSITAEIVLNSSRVMEKAGHEFSLLACALSTDMTRSAHPHGVALLLPTGHSCWLRCWCCPASSC